MVTEISIALRATADTLFPIEHGRAVKGWFYNVLRAADLELPTPPHDGSLGLQRSLRVVYEQAAGPRRASGLPSIFSGFYLSGC